MVKLLKKMKKEQGTAKGKQLDDNLSALQKLEKQRAKVKVEDAKNKLFDAAIQLKKLKKKWETLAACPAKAPPAVNGDSTGPAKGLSCLDGLLKGL